MNSHGTGAVPIVQLSSPSSWGKLGSTGPGWLNFHRLLSLTWDSAEVLRPQVRCLWVRPQRGGSRPRVGRVKGLEAHRPLLGERPVTRRWGRGRGLAGLPIFRKKPDIPNVTCNCTAFKCRQLSQLLFKKTPVLAEQNVPDSLTPLVAPRP